MFLGVWSYVLLIKDTAVHQVILPRYQVQALQKSRNTTSTSQRKPLGQWNVCCIGWLIMIDPCTWSICCVCLFIDLLYGNFSRFGHICNNKGDDNWGVFFSNCLWMLHYDDHHQHQIPHVFFCPYHFPVLDLLEWEGQTKKCIFHGNSWQYKWIHRFDKTNLPQSCSVHVDHRQDEQTSHDMSALSRHINSKYVYYIQWT